MVVRPVRAADFAAIAELTNRFIRETAIHFAYEPVLAEELADLWARQRERYPWLIAEIDSAFAGYAKAGPWRDRTAYQWTTETAIYVEPALQRRGVGRALYGRLLDVLRAQGFHSAVGGITLPNASSVRLHEALGFRRVGEFRDAGFKLGAWHDVGFWQVVLQPEGHVVSAPPGAPRA